MRIERQTLHYSPELFRLQIPLLTKLLVPYRVLFRPLSKYLRSLHLIPANLMSVRRVWAISNANESSYKVVSVCLACNSNMEVTYRMSRAQATGYAGSNLDRHTFASPHR